MKKYLLVSVLAIFAVSSQAASFKQSDIKSKPKANVSVSEGAVVLPVPTSTACKQCQSDVEKLVAERKAAYEVLQKAVTAVYVVNNKLAEKNKYIKDNKCPVEMQIPDAVLKDPVISNGKISTTKYIPPKIK
jgi:hypothetical protein